MFVSQATPGGLVQHRADGTGKDSVVVSGLIDEGAIAPDGSWVLFRVGATGTVSRGRDILGIRRGDTARVPLVVTRYDEEAAMVSPDGKWLAYQSDETGRTEVFVRSFPNTDAFKKQVSSGGGEAPLWSRDGRELYFVSGAHDMMASRVTPGAPLGMSEPAPLFRISEDLLQVEYAFYTPWDIARDGRFIMARQAHSAGDQSAVIVVAENWLRELKAKMKR